MKLPLSKCGRADEPVPFDEPSRIVGLLESQQRLTQVLDRIESPDPEQVVFQGSDEPLGAAVSFLARGRTRANSRRRGTRSPSGSDPTCIESRGRVGVSIRWRRPWRRKAVEPGRRLATWSLSRPARLSRAFVTSREFRFKDQCTAYGGSACSLHAQGRRSAAPVIGLASVTFSAARMRHSPLRRVTTARINAST